MDHHLRQEHLRDTLGIHYSEANQLLGEGETDFEEKAAFVNRHFAATREAATHHGLEHYPGMTLKAVISDLGELTIPQMLDLAEVLPPPGSPMWRPPEE